MNWQANSSFLIAALEKKHILIGVYESLLDKAPAL